MKAIPAVIALLALGLGATAVLKPGSETITKAPELTDGPWLNQGKTKPFSSKVTLVHFYTFGCINCKHNLPMYNRLNAKFGKEGLQVIGVHTPETSYEHNVDQVKEEARLKGMSYPILLDHESKNWDKWHINAWPSFFVVDNKRQVLLSWVGEADAEDEKKITDKIEGWLGQH